MALPAGFNPNDMSFGNLAKTSPIIEIPRNTSSGTRNTSCRNSLWSRINNGVASIGNWFAGHAEGALGVCSLIAMATIIITGIVYVIGTWIDEGFWTALFTAVIACVVGVISWYIAAVAIVIIVNVVMYGLRLLFWNGWTLILTIVLAIGCWLWTSNAMQNYAYQSPVQTEVVESKSRTYQCTAAVLNIRSAPNTYSNVIGVLKKDQQVEVIEKNNGFARISYNGHTGYVSLKYLNQIK